MIQKSREQHPSRGKHRTNREIKFARNHQNGNCQGNCPQFGRYREYAAERTEGEELFGEEGEDKNDQNKSHYHSETREDESMFRSLHPPASLE